MSHNLGTPGVSAAIQAENRRVFRSTDGRRYYPGGVLIDGALSYDAGNTGDTDLLRAGKLMGKITASGKYMPSIFGVTTVAYADGDTTLTVGAATAVAISAVIGSSGSVKLVGPPAANGQVSVTTVAYSAINTTTGVLTVTDANVNAIAGSFVCPTNGAEDPLSFISDGYPLQVTDEFRQTRQDTEWDQVPISGMVDSSQLIDWPSDTSLQAWIVQRLNDLAGGKFTFDHLYQ